jgi:hypothetical protein
VFQATFAKSGPITAMLAVALVACDDGAIVEMDTTLGVLLTDANAQYIGEAFVDIGSVELLGGSGGPIVLSDDGTDGPVDLLQLQDAATTQLASADIPIDTYTQLRLIVESASVTLAPGYEFTDNSTSMDLSIPSGAQTGIKLNLGAAANGIGGGVQVTPGQMVLVVDFDVNSSFIIQGNPGTPAGITGVSFQPTLRVAVDDVAGSISGAVATSEVGLTLEGLVVTATPVDGTTLEPFQTQSATAVVDANGNYQLHFLVPGEYQVTIDAGVDFAAAPVTITVDEGAAITGVDLEVVAS